jgi:hypothetical protein
MADADRMILIPHFLFFVIVGQVKRALHPQSPFFSPTYLHALGNSGSNASFN